MSFIEFLFYLFAGMAIFSATLVITVRNPVYAALLLIVTFFSTAALWLLLEAEFLAITLVLVYVGAVMVLFLFVVMMLDINITVLREGFASHLPLAGLVALFTMGVMGGIVLSDRFGLIAMPQPAAKPADYSNVSELGMQLYTDYVLQFELAAVILLVAIIAAIALTLRRRSGVKSQSVSQQVAAKKSDRLKIINLPTEERR
jgi:NADH-quinone oxidoreductase subunit J